MYKTELTNGIKLWYESDAQGELILQYPDGSRIRTTWTQVGLMERAVQNLRDLYEYLLLRAAGESDAADPPVEKLVQLDDLLFALSSGADAGRSGELLRH